MAFTSDLSVAEFALAAEAGLRPLRLVGGAGLFRLPPPARRTESDYLRPGGTSLMPAQADYWNHARDTVLARLRDEAAACGADLVTGVSLRRRVPGQRPSPIEPADWYQEITATGTAMAHRDSGRRPTPGAGPVLTNLRVQEYWKLTAAGHVPAGLVAATAVAAGRSAWESDPPPDSQGSRTAAAQATLDWQLNRGLQDRPEYHAIMRQAYSAALDKLRADAARLDGAGVASVTIERDRARWSLSEGAEHTAVFVHATGTAVTASASVPAITIMPVRYLGG